MLSTKWLLTFLIEWRKQSLWSELEKNMVGLVNGLVGGLEVYLRAFLSKARRQKAVAVATPCLLSVLVSWCKAFTIYL